MANRDNIPTILLSDIKSDEEIDKFIQSYNNCKNITNKIIKILQKEVYSNREAKISDFKDPNWAFKRAYQDGLIAGLEKAIKLLPKNDN